MFDVSPDRLTIIISITGLLLILQNKEGFNLKTKTHNYTDFVVSL